MKTEEISQVLTDLFGNAVQFIEPDAWQAEVGGMRLLVILSADQSWLRSLVTIAPAQDALPFLEQLLEANFDETQETRYAFYDGLLWGVFQHSRETLTSQDLQSAVKRLVTLHEIGLGSTFDRLAELQIRQIIRAAKQQGQSLEATMQTLDRLYEEGVMGDLDQGSEQRENVLGAWQYQLERLWNQVD